MFLIQALSHLKWSPPCQSDFFFLLKNLIGKIILVDQHATHLIDDIEYVYLFDTYESIGSSHSNLYRSAEPVHKASPSQ